MLKVLFLLEASKQSNIIVEYVVRSLLIFLSSQIYRESIGYCEISHEREREEHKVIEEK